MNAKRMKASQVPFRCIYCGEAKRTSREHYLPECLGNFKGFQTLDGRICRDCNGKIGRALEDQFCHAGEIGFMRHALGTQGKKAHKKRVNPFRRGSAGAPPYNMKGKMLGGDREALFEVIEGSIANAMYIPHMTVTDDAGQEHYIRIPDDMTDSTELEERIKALGIEKIKQVNILVPTSERERVDKLVSGLPVTTSDWTDLPMKDGPVSLIANYEVDDKYFRAIAKIGFHYVLKHFAFRGDEDEFANIRNFIMDGGDITQFVSHSKKQITEQVKWGMVTTTYTHFIIAKSEPGHLSCSLQFFLGPHVSTPDVYTVELGRTQSKIYSEAGHAFSYYPDGPQDGFTGVMVKLENYHPIIHLTGLKS